MKDYLLRDNNIIGIDFQGWDIHKMNIRDMLQALGAFKEGNNWVLPESEILDIYPRTLEDDGMGYGINEKYITTIDLSSNYCNMFIDTPEEYNVKDTEFDLSDDETLFKN